jgi:hypothetical protein
VINGLNVGKKMNQRILASLLMGGLLVSVLPSQLKMTIPSWAATLEGNSSSTYPLSYTQVRWDYLADSKALGRSVAQIKGFSFRIDSGSSFSVGTKKTLKPVITFYRVRTSPSTMSKTWTANIGTAKGTVVFNGTLNLPAATPALPSPAKFSVRIPLKAPFILTVLRDNLLIDWQEKQPYVRTPWSADAAYIAKTPGSITSRIWENRSCFNAGGDQAYLSISRTTGVLGGSMDVRYTMKPAAGHNLDALLNWIGSNNLKWGAIPLPLPLGFLGMPKCVLATDILLTQVGLTSPVKWPIPNNNALVGLTLYTQGMALDTKSSRMVITDNAWAVRLLPNPPGPQPFQSLYRSRYTNQTTGFMSSGFYAPVIQFDGLFR